MGKHGKSGTVVVVNGCGDCDDHDDHRDHKKKTDCCSPCGATKDGAAFVAAADIGTLAPPAVEIPTALLVNPVGSGKNLYVNTRTMSVLGSEDEAVSFKWYFDPQVIALGTPGTVVNTTTTPAAQPTVAQFFTAPNVASNGTLVDVFASPTGSTESSATIIVGEGHSLLVTERATAEGIRAASAVYWSECKVPKMHGEPDGDEGDEG